MKNHGRYPDCLVLPATLISLLAFGFVATEAQTVPFQEWFRIHDGPAHGVDIPNAATLDASRNLYITGRSGGIGTGQDALTLKYSPTGEELFALRYNGPTSGWDEADAIVVDSGGHIYVTGTSAYASSDWSMLTIKYNPDGSQAWLRNFPPDYSFSAGGKAVQLDAQGNIYVAGSPDLTVVKYSSEGALLWTRTQKRDTSFVNDLRACAVTPDGHVYITGVASEECPEGICRFDMVTVKYDPNGTTLWTRYYTLNENSDEQPVAIVLDGQENVTIVGRDLNFQTYIIKYSPLGDQLWAQHYTGPLSYTNPSAIAVDRDNNIVVAGTTWNTEFDYYAAKYSPSGSLLWFTTYDHGNPTRDFSSGMALDQEGNIYLTGGSRVGFLGNSTCVTVKLDSSGNRVWTSSIVRPDSGTTYGNWVFVDSASNVYIAGDGAGSNGWDFHALKLQQRTVDVREPDNLPATTFLFQNYPNPFNPNTIISYELPQHSRVVISVFDILGRQVTLLLDEFQEAGSYQRTFNAHGLASGVYLYRLNANGFVQNRKMILEK